MFFSSYRSDFVPKPVEAMDKDHLINTVNKLSMEESRRRECLLELRKRFDKDYTYTCGHCQLHTHEPSKRVYDGRMFEDDWYTSGKEEFYGASNANWNCDFIPVFTNSHWGLNIGDIVIPKERSNEYDVYTEAQEVAMCCKHTVTSVSEYSFTLDTTGDTPWVYADISKVEQQKEQSMKTVIIFTEQSTLLDEVYDILSAFGYDHRSYMDEGCEELIVTQSDGGMYYSDGEHVPEDSIIVITNDNIKYLPHYLNWEKCPEVSRGKDFKHFYGAASSGTDTKNNKPKGTTMKSAITTQMDNNKAAAIMAAEITAGKVLNNKVVSIIKPKMPMMVRGYMDSPLASVAIANLVGIALKQYMPNNDKAAKVSELMLNASALQLMESFNIESMLDDLLAGIKLPETTEGTNND